MALSQVRAWVEHSFHIVNNFCQFGQNIARETPRDAGDRHFRESEVTERIKLLEAGADDYLGNPFDFGELWLGCGPLRAGRAIAASGEQREPKLSFANMVLYPHRRCALTNGRHVVLRRTELALFETLIDRAGQPIERAMLMTCVYTQPKKMEVEPAHGSHPPFAAETGSSRSLGPDCGDPGCRLRIAITGTGLDVRLTLPFTGPEKER
jgi:hypothetical protein